MPRTRKHPASPRKRKAKALDSEGARAILARPADAQPKATPAEEAERIAATPTLAKRMGVWTRPNGECERARVDGDADLEIWEAPTTGDFTPKKYVIRPRPVRVIGHAEAGAEVVVVVHAGEHYGMTWELVRWLGGKRKVACQGYVLSSRLSPLKKSEKGKEVPHGSSPSSHSSPH